MIYLFILLLLRKPRLYPRLATSNAFYGSLTQLPRQIWLNEVRMVQAFWPFYQLHVNVIIEPKSAPSRNTTHFQTLRLAALWSPSPHP